jgi:hypothetical protein
MDNRQQRKDDHHRRRLWRTLAVAGVAGVLLLVGFDVWLRRLAEDADLERALRLVALASMLLRFAIALVAVLLGRYLLDWARQTTEQGQWPPAGLEWPGKSPHRHGADAQRVAGRLRLAGITSMVVALALAGWSAWRAWS